MAGGVTKGFGFTFLILGILLVVAAIAAAGYGFYLFNEQADRGVFADSDQADMGEALLMGAAIGGGIGLALLLVGGILIAVGGSLARREMLRAIQTSGAAVAPPVAAAPSTSRRTGWIVAGVIGGILLVAFVAMAMSDANGSGSAWGGLTSNGSSSAQTATVSISATGHVQGARAPLVGGFTTANSNSVHEMPLTPGFYALHGALNWSAAGPTGASTLVMILDAEQDGVWTELARGEGGPGLVVELPAQQLPAKVRARIFVGGSGAADQDYTVELVARG